MITQNFRSFFIALFGSILMLSGCLKDDFLDNQDTVPQAGFTMMNVYSGADFIIHKADNNFIQTMSNPLQFKNINFVYLYPGNRKIQTIDKDNKVIIDSTYTIKDSILYTSIIYTKPNLKIDQRLIEDKLINTKGTSSAIRFMNFAHDEIGVDLFVGDTKVVDNRAYDGNLLVSDHYKFVSQSTGAKKITIKNNAEDILVEKDVTLSSGMHYSFILIKNVMDNMYEIIIHQQYRN